MEIQAKQNSSETSLQRWLRETKARNLSYNQLETHLRSISRTPFSIYRVLDGNNTNQKATALYNRWRKEGSIGETESVKINVNIDKIKEAISEVLTTNKKPHVSKFGYESLVVPLGTYVKVKNGSSVYKISEDQSTKDYNSIAYNILNTNRQTVYTFHMRSTQINDNILTGNWIPEEMTKELEEKIKNYTNVIYYEEFFKKTGRVRKSDGMNGLESYVCKFNEVSGASFYVSPGATGNCQLNIIGAAQNIIALCTNPREQFVEIYKVSGRALMLVDLNRNQVDKFKELFSDLIILEQSYISSNGSDMTIMIANFKKELPKDYDEDYYEDEDYDEDDE